MARDVVLSRLDVLVVSDPSEELPNGNGLVYLRCTLTPIVCPEAAGEVASVRRDLPQFRLVSPHKLVWWGLVERSRQLLDLYFRDKQQHE